MNKLLASLSIALTTYSKLPCPRVEFSDENRRYSLCFFPAVGLFVGAALLLWLYLCDRWELGGLARGAVGCLLPLLISGGIHMDGFMDTMDARASWQPREKKLAILKDSHAGAFAVMGCAGYLLAQAAVLSEACYGGAAWVLALGFVLSRALSALTLMTLPGARPGGMADGFVRSAAPDAVRAVLAAVALLCGGIMCLIQPVCALAALCAGGLCLIWFRRMAMRLFGGMTGDLAGFFLQCFELCVAAAAVAAGRWI